MLISVVGDAWREIMSIQFCWKRLWLNPMWSWNVFPKFLLFGLEFGFGPEMCLGWDKGVVSYPGGSWCFIPHKGKDIQSLCPECVDSVDLYSLLGIQSFGDVVRWMWWSVADWGGLGIIWSVGVLMIGCWPIEIWKWQGWGVGVGTGRLGENVWMMTWKCLVCNLNRQCSRICGGTSYGQTVV